MITYKIPLKGLKFSTNKIYAGTHWTERKNIKDSIASIVFGLCRPIQTPDAYPVELRYRFLFRATRALDTLNCAAVAKMVEDAFRAVGILKDDSPKYVACSVLEVVEFPHKKKPKGPIAERKKANEEDEDWLEINIYPYEFKP